MEINYDKGIFASNLNRFIVGRGINSKYICTYLGVSKSVVSDWRNGKKMPRMDKIERLAHYFGVGISDLIESPEESSISADDELSDLDRDIIDLLKQADDQTKRVMIALLQQLQRQ